MDFSASAFSDSRTLRKIPAQARSAQVFAAEAACFRGVSTKTEYPCLRAVANSAAAESRSQATTICFNPSKVGGGNVASFHSTKTVPHADVENTMQTKMTIMFLKLMRSVLEPDESQPFAEEDLRSIGYCIDFCFRRKPDGRDVAHAFDQRLAQLRAQQQ